jgi:hypothetical protein
MADTTEPIQARISSFLFLPNGGATLRFKYDLHGKGRWTETLNEKQPDKKKAQLNLMI